MHWKQQMLPPLLEGYDPDDIYNLDETGLFFKCLPDKTLAFKGERCHGGKSSKERITVVPICNSTGTHKYPLIVIGKYNSPRCFKNVHSLPVHYYANTKAWMTTDIFNDILIRMDNEFDSEGRRVLLLIDNCPSHKLKPTTTLKAIRIEFFPANYTSVLQPLDAGIIKNLKHYYRQRLLREAIHHINEHEELNKVDVLQAITTVSAAWHDDVKAESIANCFRHVGFHQNELMVDDSHHQADPAVTQALVEEFAITLQQIAGGGPMDAVNVNDYMDIDNDIVVINTGALREVRADMAVNVDETSASSSENSSDQLGGGSAVDAGYMDVDTRSSEEIEEVENVDESPASSSQQTMNSKNTTQQAILIVQSALQQSATLTEQLKNSTLRVLASLFNE